MGGKLTLKKIFPPQNGFTSSERASALTAVIGVDVHIFMPEVGSEQRIAAGTGTQHDVVWADRAAWRGSSSRASKSRSVGCPLRNNSTPHRVTTTSSGLKSAPLRPTAATIRPPVRVAPVQGRLYQPCECPTVRATRSASASDAAPATWIRQPWTRPRRPLPAYRPDPRVRRSGRRTAP